MASQDWVNADDLTHTAATVLMTIGPDDEVYVAAVFQRAGGLLSLPKGRVELGDMGSTAACAMRELGEEVGMKRGATMSAPQYIGSHHFEKQGNVVSWFAVVTPEMYLNVVDTHEVCSSDWLSLRDIMTNKKYVNKCFANRSFRVFRNPATVSSLRAFAYAMYDANQW